MNGKLTLESKKGCTIYSDYDIKVKDNALLTASTEDPSQDIGAMYCVLGEIFLENTILNCSSATTEDADINIVLIEEMPAYFSGQKSLDQVIKIAQDRVQKILDERG